MTCFSHLSRVQSVYIWPAIAVTYIVWNKENLEFIVYNYIKFNYIWYINNGDWNMGISQEQYEEFTKRLEEELFDAIDGTEEN